MCARGGLDRLPRPGMSPVDGASNGKVSSDLSERLFDAGECLAAGASSERPSAEVGLGYCWVGDCRPPGGLPRAFVRREELGGESTRVADAAHLVKHSESLSPISRRVVNLGLG